MINRTFGIFSRSACALLALAALGCSDGTSVGGTADVRVLLTDAPADYIDHAMVDVGAVELIGGPDGPVLLTEDGTDGPVDLLELRGAATRAIAEAEIAAGTYAQLRLFVESASVTLAEGYTFTDESVEQELTVPSGAQTGIKLNLGTAEGEGDGGPVEIAPGQTVLVLDFDVNESFVLQGSPDTPAGISGVSFQPTLRVAVSDVAGSVSGTVSTGLAGVSVEGLVVRAVPDNEGTVEAYQTVEATDQTNADGTYTVHFLVPGDYTISVETEAGLTAGSVSVTVGDAEDVTGVDFQIVEG